MSEAVGNGAQVEAHGEELGGDEVPKVVDPHVPEPGLSTEPNPAAGDSRWSQGPLTESVGTEAAAIRA